MNYDVNPELDSILRSPPEFPNRLRTLLFIPSGNERFIVRANELNDRPDAIILDLEDSIPEKK
ncbi:MAG: hypothetical protein ACE5KG_00195 [Nitrososphaerales archaeon]